MLCWYEPMDRVCCIEHGGKTFRCPDTIAQNNMSNVLNWADNQEGMTHEILMSLLDFMGKRRKAALPPARGVVKPVHSSWDTLAFQLRLPVTQVQTLFHDLSLRDIEDINKRLEWLDCDRV